ncbi:MAG: hypothetical protein B6U69_03345 [Thermofilum sp. ex4484_15]|nr:MAG: hypothetical protein B6U69_03345 [Thermofilum sp. ex4484_15]
MKEEKVLYFEEGEEATTRLLKYVKEYALQNSINYVIIASTTGRSARRALEILRDSGLNMVVVTHVSWFKEGVRQEFDEAVRRELEAKGVKVITAAHAFRGVCRALRSKYGGYGPLDIIADTFRLFSEGVKVCVEITLMAADAGYIPLGKEVIALGGTREGLDTALVLLPATSANFFNLRILKVLAKPI